MKSYMKFTLLTLVVMAALVINVSAGIILFDNMDNLDNWKVTTGTATVSGGILTLSNPSIYTQMYSKQTFPENAILLVYASVSPEKLGQGLGFYKAGNYASFFSGNGQYRFGTASTVRNYNLNYFGASTGYHLWEIDRGTDSVTFKVDGKTVGTSTTFLPQGKLPIGISSHYPNRDVKVDWVMVLEG